MTTNRIQHLLESDEDKVTLVTNVVGAAVLFEQEGTWEARRLLARAVRDCLERVLHREPTKEEVRRVLRGEAG